MYWRFRDMKGLACEVQGQKLDHRSTLVWRFLFLKGLQVQALQSLHDQEPQRSYAVQMIFHYGVECEAYEGAEGDWVVVAMSTAYETFIACVRYLWRAANSISQLLTAYSAAMALDCAHLWTVVKGTWASSCSKQLLRWCQKAIFTLYHAVMFCWQWRTSDTPGQGCRWPR